MAMNAFSARLSNTEGTYAPSFTAIVSYGTPFAINVCTPFIGCFFETDFLDLGGYSQRLCQFDHPCRHAAPRCPSLLRHRSGLHGLDGLVAEEARGNGGLAGLRLPLSGHAA
jgi:hypothetical protein